MWICINLRGFFFKINFCHVMQIYIINKLFWNLKKKRDEMVKVSYTLRTYVQRQMFRGETSRTPYPRLGAPFTKTGAGPVSLWFEAARFRSPPTRLFGHYWWMDPHCEQSEIAETRVSANINKFIFSPFKWKNFDSHFYSKSLGSFQMMNTTLHIKSVFS